MSLRSPSEIFVRAYTEKPGARPLAAKPAGQGEDRPSPWVLIFDCETAVDAAQSLRVGVYQIRKSGDLTEEGLFWDLDTVSEGDLAVIKHYATHHGLKLLSADQFRKDVFLKIAYLRNGLLIGFNLPFDISRIAINHGAARGSMRGGFTFHLTRYKSDPQIRVKHLSARAALIDFAKPGKQDTPRGMRKRGLKVGHNRGYFVDVKTLAAALTSRSFSLDSLCQFLKTPVQKLKTDEHGGPITPDYLDYARTDVQATWECFEELSKRYDAHCLETGVHRILSEASIGKAYLKQMQIKPFLGNLPDFPREIFGQIMCAYYGGRAEVRIRREPTQVLYCDFKSMYPTVSALMGLWDFIIGEEIAIEDDTDRVQDFLNTVSLEDMQVPATWKHLRTLVQIRTAGDLLPVRAKYDGKTNTIGLNHITNPEPLWYTLADCVASKVLTGKTPIIDKAMTFVPVGVQSDLQKIDLFGNPAYRVDPATEDVFTRLIDLRDEARAKGDPVQQAIKIVANSTSYGIFIEVNRDDAPKPEPLDVYGPSGERQSVTILAVEEPGRYFHPLLGTLITGAARLMLALSERVASDQGLGWVFCDTDSLAMAKPKDMDRETFLQRGRAVIDWFKALNPYRKPGSILDVEDANFKPGTNVHEPLYCLAISAKRYALFNLDQDGKPVLRKASAHGLGHLLAPYGADDLPDDLGIPDAGASATGVSIWQHHYWLKVIEAAHGDSPNIVKLDYHPAFGLPCISRYGATSPALLKWMDSRNEGKPYAEQVKPFGFLTAFIARSGAFSEAEEPVEVDPTQRGRPHKTSRPKPIAPFERNATRAVDLAFDRITGASVNVNQLKTYAEALAQFHMSTEDKFENGDFMDRGPTRRRHVFVETVGLIGKEANKVGAHGQADPVATAEAIYGIARKWENPMEKST
ncbi:MAG: hypothetical protein HUJ27_06145 [Rhodobacteraceae bacterium]|nr:hypothetical protein [Paracoccaceae bacterium]